MISSSRIAVRLAPFALAALAMLAACTGEAPTSLSSSPPSLAPVASRTAAEDSARDAERAEFDRLMKEWKKYEESVKKGTVTAELLRCEPRKREANTRTIGPKGGEIQVGPHRLRIPAGALDRNVTISGVAPSGPIVDVEFEPHGLQFAAPVELTLDYDHCIVPARQQLQVVYLGVGKKIVAEQPSSDHRDLSQVRAVTDHFSGYAVATRTK
jgi:hypothetical protein